MLLVTAGATLGIASCGSKTTKAPDTVVGSSNGAPPPSTAAAAPAAPASSDTKAAAPADTKAAAPDTAPAPESSAAATTVGSAAPGSTVGCPKADGSSPPTKKFAAAPPMCIDPAKTYRATVETGKGSFTITFDAKKAPITVNNFVFLARFHFYDGSGFHRVVPNFVIQGGSGDGQGGGGPGYAFQDELPQAGEYKIGSIAMANAGANTNDSQFFVITGANGAALPPSYSLFGAVTQGMDTVNAIAALGTGDGPPSEPVAITKVTIQEG